MKAELPQPPVGTKPSVYVKRVKGYDEASRSDKMALKRLFYTLKDIKSPYKLKQIEKAASIMSRNESRKPVTNCLRFGNEEKEKKKQRQNSLKKTEEGREKLKAQKERRKFQSDLLKAIRDGRDDIKQTDVMKAFGKVMKSRRRLIEDGSTEKAANSSVLKTVKSYKTDRLESIMKKPIKSGSPEY